MPTLTSDSISGGYSAVMDGATYKLDGCTASGGALSSSSLFNRGVLTRHRNDGQGGVGRTNPRRPYSPKKARHWWRGDGQWRRRQWQRWRGDRKWRWRQWGWKWRRRQWGWQRDRQRRRYGQRWQRNDDRRKLHQHRELDFIRKFNLDGEHHQLWTYREPVHRRVFIYRWVSHQPGDEWPHQYPRKEEHQVRKSRSKGQTSPGRLAVACHLDVARKQCNGERYAIRRYRCVWPMAGQRRDRCE